MFILLVALSLKNPTSGVSMKHCIVFLISGEWGIRGYKGRIPIFFFRRVGVGQFSLALLFFAPLGYGSFFWGRGRGAGEGNSFCKNCL